jgi:hypothetical protein
MSILFWALSIVGLLLQAALVQVLISTGRWRQYFPLFLYAIVLVLTGVLDKGLRFDISSVQYRVIIYWTNESIRWLFQLIVIFWLLFHALKPLKGITYYLTVVSGASAAVLLSAVLQESNGSTLSAWFTQFLRNVSVIAMILNVVLWGLLLTNRPAPRGLMLLSAGVGVQMAGDAIGHSVRLFTLYFGKNLLIAGTGNVIFVLSHLLCLGIWVYAVRSQQAMDLRSLPAALSTRSGDAAIDHAVPLPPK